MAQINKVVLLMVSLHHNVEIDDSLKAKQKLVLKTKFEVDVAHYLYATYYISYYSTKWRLIIFYATLKIWIIMRL